MYVYITDHGYEGYSTAEYNTLDELVDSLQYDDLTDFHALYEVREEISKAELNNIIKNTQATRAAENREKRRQIMSKLSADEIEFLGLRV